MKNRSPFAVFIFPCITFGIYGIYWYVKTKGEINNLTDAKIPTAWLLIIPLVNLWWMWKYSEGVDKVTKGQLSAAIAFILLFLLGSIGMAIIQNDFNQVGSQPAAAGQPTPPAIPNSTPSDSSSPTPPPAAV